MTWLIETIVEAGFDLTDTNLISDLWEMHWPTGESAFHFAQRKNDIWVCCGHASEVLTRHHYLLHPNA